MTGGELFVYKVKHSQSVANVLEKLFRDNKITLQIKNKNITIVKVRDGYRMWSETEDYGKWYGLFWLAGKVIEVARC